MQRVTRFLYRVLVPMPRDLPALAIAAGVIVGIVRLAKLYEAPHPPWWEGWRVVQFLGLETPNLASWAAVLYFVGLWTRAGRTSTRSFWLWMAGLAVIVFLFYFDPVMWAGERVSDFWLVAGAIGFGTVHAAWLWRERLRVCALAGLLFWVCVTWLLVGNVETEGRGVGLIGAWIS